MCQREREHSFNHGIYNTVRLSDLLLNLLEKETISAQSIPGSLTGPLKDRSWFSRKWGSYK